MSSRIFTLVAVLALAAGVGCAGLATPAATPTRAPETPVSPTDTPTLTPTPGPAATASPGPAPTSTADLLVVDEAMWNDKVELTLWIAAGDDIVSPRDTVDLRATVRNVSDQPVAYTMWNVGDTPVYFNLETPFNETIRLRPDGAPDVVVPAIDSQSLEPGGLIEREIQWGVTLPSPSGEAPPAPNGDYLVHADFFPVTGDAPDPENPLRASVEISVVGSANSVRSQDAVDRALGVAAVERWMQAHTGRAVARRNSDGELFINLEGNWQPASPEEFQEAQSRQPAPSVKFSEGKWVVSLSERYGYPPREIAVRVHPETGDIVSVTPDLQEELQGGVVAVFEADGTRFSVFVTNQQTIEELLALHRQESQASIPNGRLLPGPGAGLHNVPWSWHLDPEGISMAEATTEVCDGDPELVHQDLQYWLDNVGRYCPWNAQLAEILDYR